MALILAQETSPQICIHCGTSLFANASSPFCCAGCEFVYGLIRAENLDEYYKIRDANPPSCPVPAQTSSSTYDFCDEPEFIARVSPDGLRIRFYLEGMNCTACVWLLEKLPQFCADAQRAQINMAESTIEVTRKADGSFAAIAQTLNRFGYRPHPLRESETSRQLQKKENRKDLIRIGVAAACTGNIMIFAVSLYGGATGELAEQFRWISAALATPVLTYCAWPFYRSTYASLRSRQLNLDVPIVAAIVSGIIVSIWGLIGAHDRGAETVYFDSLSMLVFLLLSSRFVLKGVQHRQLQATNLEDELLLSTVEKLTATGEFIKVSSLSLVEGDVIRINVDAVIPADGVVISGEGAINAAVMTGESEPVMIYTGSQVEAGSQNMMGEWMLKVQNIPAKTRLAQILRDTEKSAKTKSRFVHFSDRVSVWFIAIVMTLAALVVLAFIGTAPQEGIARALALVIVTCPCVFGIAIPLSMSYAIRGAARRGVIIKNNDAIERLWKIKTLYFDKTGTLTTGAMAVLGVDNIEGKLLDLNSDLNKLHLGLVLGLEKNQLHPVARALVKHLKGQNIIEVALESIHNLPTGGVRGQFAGNTYSVLPLDESSPAGTCSHTSHGNLIRSSYGLFKNNNLCLRFHMGDQPRPQSKTLLNWARKNGFTTRLISGDKKHVVSACARDLGFAETEFESQVQPEDKAIRLKEISNKTRSHAAMIGDGANDAAALASAEVGIAVCGSLDVSLRAADVYLTRPDLNSIAELFEIARMTKTAIYRNLFFSASFNLISGALAISGLMTPLWAAVLMPLSSLTVLLSAVWTGQQFGDAAIPLKKMRDEIK